MGPTKLAIYDFDGTLFRSPEKPIDWSSGDRWWGDPASLSPPIVPENPGPEWWNGSVAQRAKQDTGNPDTLSVLVTGRLAKRFTGRVRDLLAQAGLRFNHVFLSPGGNTNTFKTKVIDQLLKDNHTIRGVDIWEDRVEHLRQYADHVESKGKAAFPHLITVPAHAPDVMRVARRYLRAGVQSVGLFIPLPEEIASKFPSLETDPSPTHATLLVVGDIDPEDEDHFMDVVRDHLSRWPSSVTATLKGVSYFDNPDATVAYDLVRFDEDVAGLRSDLATTLIDHGFNLVDRSPVVYRPHVTLEYLPPNSLGEYDGPVPGGSWEFDSVDVWCGDGDPVKVPLGDASSSRVAARYQKKTEDDDGNVHYEYGPRQIANRHKEKAERVEHLRQNISDLRARVKDDLKDEDPATQMTALVVALMDETCERVGNDDSADEGHFGVTGWMVKHVTFKGDQATFEYVGKSGVKHEKVVENGPVVTALKDLAKGRGDDDCLFETDEVTVNADDVNDYLAEFDVTAKDIRGFRANDEMLKALKTERAKGPKELPFSRKDKDDILKAEFKRALEHVAEVVGHESSTLRSQYLVPGLEESYVHDGTILKSLKVGTKTEAEWEDEEIEDLSKPAPPNKPPRHDLRKERLDVDDDDTDEDDEDLSLNFKKVASRALVSMSVVRVAHRWSTAAKEDDESNEEFQKHLQDKKPKFPNPDPDSKKSHPEIGYSTLKEHNPEAAKKYYQEWAASREKDDKPKEDGGKEKAEEDKAKDKAKEEKRLKEPVSDEAANELASSFEKLKDLPKDVANDLARSLKDVVQGQTTEFFEKVQKAISDERQDVLDRAAKDRASGKVKTPEYPEGMMNFGDETGKSKSRKYDPNDMEAAIRSNTSKRDKTQQDVKSYDQSIRDAEPTTDSLETSIHSYSQRAEATKKALEEMRGGPSKKEKANIEKIRGSLDGMKGYAKAREKWDAMSKADQKDAEKAYKTDLAVYKEDKKSYDEALTAYAKETLPKYKADLRKFDEAEKAYDTWWEAGGKDGDPKAPEKPKRPEKPKAPDEPTEPASPKPKPPAGMKEDDDPAEAIAEAEAHIKDVQDPAKMDAAIKAKEKELKGYEASVTAYKNKLKDHQTKIEKAKKELPKVQERLDKENADLVRQMAFHGAMAPVVADMSNPLKGSSNVGEAAKEYAALPKDIADKRKERAQSEHKKLTDDYDTATGDEKDKIKEQLDVVNADLAAARYHDIKSGEGKEDDLGSKLIGKSKTTISNPHVQTLLREGGSTPEGRAAIWNLAESLSNDDLVDMAGDAGKDFGDFSEMGPRSSALARKAILTRMMIKESGGTITGKELDALVETSASLAKSTEIGSRGIKWIKSLPKNVREKVVSRLPERVTDLFKKRPEGQGKEFELERPKTEEESLRAGRPPFRSAARVAARFLGYVEGGR